MSPICLNCEIGLPELYKFTFYITEYNFSVLVQEARRGCFPRTNSENETWTRMMHWCKVRIWNSDLNLFETCRVLLGRVRERNSRVFPSTFFCEVSVHVIWWCKKSIKHLIPKLQSGWETIILTLQKRLKSGVSGEVFHKPNLFDIALYHLCPW